MKNTAHDCRSYHRLQQKSVSRYSELCRFCIDLDKKFSFTSRQQYQILKIIYRKSNTSGRIQRLYAMLNFCSSTYLSRYASHRNFTHVSRSACRWICATARNDTTDEKFMRHAIRMAKIAASKKEVPIGAILVDNSGVILSEAHNEVESFHDCTRHAEMTCIRNAMSSRKAWRLYNTTLFCTLEPCAMCLSALALARVSRIVYGAPDIRLGACGSWINLTDSDHPYHKFDEVIGGILQDECASLVKEFFRERRKGPRYSPPERN